MQYPAVTLTSNGTTQLLYVRKKRVNPTWIGTFVLTGTFGGGTVKFQISMDNGVTKTDLRDATGTVFSTTTANNFNMELAGGDVIYGMPILYAVLSGATNPAITITFTDNI